MEAAVRWNAFVERAGELGAHAVHRIGDEELSLLGTLRADGSPRISPCEAYVVDGELLLGMMWQSRKARDLLRDPRITVHSTQCDKSGSAGDVKLYGVAVDVLDPGLRERYADTLHERIDWRPPEPFHLFALDVREASFVRFGAEPAAMRWTEAGGLVRLRHPDDGQV
jgi:hypothetical protein